MKQHDIKKYFSVLLAIMIAILAGCLVILLVFRTQLLVNGAARIFIHSDAFYLRGGDCLSASSPVPVSGTAASFSYEKNQRP